MLFNCATFDLVGMTLGVGGFGLVGYGCSTEEEHTQVDIHITKKGFHLIMKMHMYTYSVLVRMYVGGHSKCVVYAFH